MRVKKISLPGCHAVDSVQNFTLSQSTDDTCIILPQLQQTGHTTLWTYPVADIILISTQTHKAIIKGVWVGRGVCVCECVYVCVYVCVCVCVCVYMCVCVRVPS